MPVIKARPASQKTKVRLIAHLTMEHHETLQEYATFIGEERDTDYVIGQLIETVLAKDKDFIANRRATAVALARHVAKSA